MENDVLYNRIMNVVHEEYGPPGGGGTDQLADYLNGVTPLTLSSDNVTAIYSGAMRRNVNDFSISFPNCTVVDNAAMRDAKVVSAYLPKVKQIQPNAFRLSTLTYAIFQSLEVINDDALDTISTLTACDFGNSSKTTACDIKQWAFYNSANMNVLILRDAVVAVLENVNAFSGTPFASNGAGGTIYVPSALISSYQSATNWSTILGYANNSIQAIEGSIYETQYVDGTPIPTP